ncbi:MAG: lipase maturation factor family protein [Myxococcaceae bacterium]
MRQIRRRVRKLRRRVRRVHLGPPRAQEVRWLFLRGFGLTGLVAFRSLRRQVLGLFGSKGIVPVEERLTFLRENLDRRRYLRFPSVLWFGASDRALMRWCRVGEGASALLLAGIAPRLSSFVVTSSYVSFLSVGHPFLSYQWDALLVETGVLATLAAPGGLRPGRGRHPPSWTTVLMFRWLGCRLHFESGVAKLQSKDEAWRKLTAVEYHHETQPLPTPLSWYARQLPKSVNKAATLWVLVVENLMPPLLLLPSHARRFAFWNLTALQAAISATGNFGFFNLLSQVILLWGLDDRALARMLPGKRRGLARSALTRAELLRQLFELPLLIPLAASSIDELVSRFRFYESPRPLRPFIEIPRSLHAVSPYGLFAVMTTTRPEINVEGSVDGETWVEYGFKYKVGDRSLLPRYTGFHMPRVDWQMWFAALGAVPAWLPVFLSRILEGSPEVISLLGTNPFPGAPPKYIRATLYLYSMTDRTKHRETGHFWERQSLGQLVLLRRRENAEAANLLS